MDQRVVTDLLLEQEQTAEKMQPVFAELLRKDDEEGEGEEEGGEEEGEKEEEEVAAEGGEEKKGGLDQYIEQAKDAVKQVQSSMSKTLERVKKQVKDMTSS